MASVLVFRRATNADCHPAAGGLQAGLVTNEKLSRAMAQQRTELGREVTSRPWQWPVEAAPTGKMPYVVEHLAAFPGRQPQ